ncbi:MAG TPA: DUF3786 domain-containing protein [Clostridia bacterium]|nr:DUF3786 domain-containing protein [Clostridia bacterium]
MNDVPGNWRPAYEEALRQFQKQPNPHRMAENTGASFQGDPGGEKGRFVLTYCGADYYISYPEGKITAAADETARVPASVQTCILLYMAQAVPVPKGEAWKTFKDLPQGYHHWAPFVLEALEPLVKGFGHDLDAFASAAEALGGRRIAAGDQGYEFAVLPRIDLQVILRAGDEEFPPQANILFNENCVMQLDTATLYMIGIDLSRRLLHQARKLEGGVS